MKFETTDETPVVGEALDAARFFPPSSSRPLASTLPNPAPATKRECGAGVGKTEGGKSGEEVFEVHQEVELEKDFEGGVGGESQGHINGNSIKEKGGGEGILEVERNGFERKTETENNGERKRKLKDLDIKILGLLEVWGALGLGQIEGVCGSEGRADEQVEGLFFNEGFKYAGRFYLRLRELERAGLAATQRALGSKQVYRLTDWGHAALRRQMAARLPSAQRTVCPSTLEHRIIGAGVGLLIERFLRLPVLSERQCYYALRTNLGGKRRAGFHLPDMTVYLPKGRCAVEVELHKKGDKSYANVWSFYKRGLKPEDRLVYLTPNQAFTQSLLETAGELGCADLYACDLPAFRRGLGRSEFRNFKGAVFHF